MITTEMIDRVMEKTGKDYFTIKKELENTGGNVDEAIKNLGGTTDAGKDTAKGKFTFNGKEIDLSAKEIMDTIKEIWEKGNASYLLIEKNGKEVFRLNLVLSGVALMLALQPVLIGLGIAVVANYDITIVMKDGEEININQKALERKFREEENKDK